MYEHFYNLSAEPFRLSPDHRFCYNHEKYAKAKAYMAYAFMRAEGFVLITGPPGTGKTTLVGDLIESLADENAAVANLVSTQLAADDLLRMVAFAFDVDAEGVDKSTLIQHLNTHFLNLNRTGGRALLIVDEAQDLTPQALEELRLLTNLQERGQPLLQIFLLGQTELQELVHSPGLQQVHQRIIAASEMTPLGNEETRAYVEHRLGAVGWQNDPLISNAVYPIIHLFSEGIPRRINLLCSRLFLHCCVEERHQITVEDARTVVAELQEEQLSTRNILHHELFRAEDDFELVFTADLEEPEQEEVARVDESEEPESEQSGEAGVPGDEAPDAAQSSKELVPEVIEALTGMAEQPLDVAMGDLELEGDEEWVDPYEWDNDQEGLDEDQNPERDRLPITAMLFGLTCATLAGLLALASGGYCEAEHSVCAPLQPFLSIIVNLLP